MERGPARAARADDPLRYRAAVWGWFGLGLFPFVTSLVAE